MKTEKLAEFVFKGFKMFRLAAGMEQAARDGQEPASSSEGACPLIESAEPLASVEHGDGSEQKGARPDDAAGAKGERLDPSTNGHPHTMIRRRTRPLS